MKYSKDTQNEMAAYEYLHKAKEFLNLIDYYDSDLEKCKYMIEKSKELLTGRSASYEK